jgi:hypothetical protein
METTTKWAATILFVSAAVLLVSGLLVWIGLYALVGFHQLFGYALIASLWTLAFAASRAGVSTGVVVGAVSWGLLVLALGWGQRYILPGSLHWIVQVLHLVISMASMAWGRWLLSSMRRRRAASFGNPA